jgi:hypothetical protein
MFVRHQSHAGAEWLARFQGAQPSRKKRQRERMGGGEVQRFRT